MKKLTVKQLAAFQKLLYVLAALLAIASYLTEEKGAPRPLLWAGFGFIVLSIAWRFIFVKCPNCGNTLSDSKTIPDVCPGCGYDLITNTPKEKNNEQDR